MSLARSWKTKAKELRYLLRGAYKRSALWEARAKDHKNVRMAKELEVARLDAFGGWCAARLLQKGLERALTRGVFDLEERITLEKIVAQVNIAKAESFDA